MSVDPFWTVLILTTASSLAADVVRELIASPGTILIEGWKAGAPVAFDSACFGLARDTGASFSEAAHRLQGGTAPDPACIEERYRVTLALGTGSLH